MTTFEEVTAAIVRFRDERDWAQFHTPRNLATALSIEAAELQETMLWKKDDEVASQLADPSQKAEMERELADILIFTLLLCHEADVDPGRAIDRKLEENARKYPVDLARGVATKYNRLNPNA